MSLFGKGRSPVGTTPTEASSKMRELVPDGSRIVRLGEFTLHAKHVGLVSEPRPNFWTCFCVFCDLLKAGSTLPTLAGSYIHMCKIGHRY